MRAVYPFFGTTLTVIFTLSTLGYGIHHITRNPCDRPKLVSIEEIDPRFGIATNTVAMYSKEAIEVWNRSYAKNDVFTYTETEGDVRIRFVYDERQRTTIVNETLKQTIDKEKEELSDIKRTIESLKNEYSTLEKTILTQTKSYNDHLKKHNDEVTYWNGRGGAPTDVYQRIQRDEASLETERIALNKNITRYNTLADQIQRYGQNHNQAVTIVNEKIQTLNKTAVREFEEGTYDPKTQIITVYEYANETALKRVLIHEFGHALALNHVDDKEAIMYSVNQGKNLTLTASDTKELLNRCREKTLHDLFLELKTMGDGIVHLGLSSLRDIVAQLR